MPFIFSTMISKNMIRFGVVHRNLLFEETCRYIDDYCKETPSSIMVELPVNWDTCLESDKVNKKSFFNLLAQRYRKKGSKIIYGDAELILPNRELDIFDIVIASHGGFDSADRDIHMFYTTLLQKPEVVVVGRNHAEKIKRKFPSSDYIAFETDFPGEQYRRFGRANSLITLIERKWPD